MTNIIGALVTMPHKIATCDLVQRLSPTAAIAGACNAIRREADGSLSGDMFDGEDLCWACVVKGLTRRGRALVVGSGGVGSAIAASLAAAGVSALTLYDTRPEVAHASPGGCISTIRSSISPDAARSCRTRAGGQCHPAGDEGQRSAAAGR